MPENFYIFNKSFPEKHLEATVDLKKCKLKTELEVLYSRKDLWKASGATTLLQFLMKNNLKADFSEHLNFWQLWWHIQWPMWKIEGASGH